MKKNEKNQKNNKKNLKKNYAKNLTCYYCGKKGHIEKDCFKRKRDAEQGNVKPVPKNAEKQEQTEIAYGLIATNRNDKTKVCSTSMNEEWEQNNVNSEHVDNLGLILLSATN